MADITSLVLRDGFDRVHQQLPSELDGLTGDQLLRRLDADANPIGWLAWHLSRVQDDHLADLGGIDQVWITGGWSTRFALPYDDGSIGYGQSTDEVGAFDVTDTSVLLGYHDAVHQLTMQVLDGLSTDADYERIVDRRWDPPVTAAARLVSVINDITQHLGQIGYLRGLVERRG
ncbi:mycothiol transferase [Flexivirga meconopsidis]|uniref:mycothiol transferase n=1 Tax=Flexivirga meconopsidis TaxID=2977121 RepID=UPI00223EF3B0|nr:DinB family protein [Flexivirga meconopsidis]